MRFLADECCDFAVVRALREAGHDVLAIAEKQASSVDVELLALALNQERILITEDKDFGWLVFAAAPALAVLATGAQLAYAQPAAKQMHLHLDPAATTVEFTLKDTLHAVHGEFHMRSGEIAVRSATGEATGRIEIDISSGASGNGTRDKRMKQEFLEAPSFPLAVFEPHKITGLNPDAPTQTIFVDGTLTLHGTPHPMTLRFAVTLNGAQATATTSFEIPYVAWGIRDPSIPFVRVAKEVTVELAAKGTLQRQ